MDILLQTSPSFSIGYVQNYLGYMELNPAIRKTGYNWKTTDIVREIGRSIRPLLARDFYMKTATDTQTRRPK